MKPYLSIAPARTSPVVLTCEHATHRLPRPGRLGGQERRVLESHWGWDIGAWSLTRDLARRLSTSAVGGRWSRLFIDLNRRIDDPTLIRKVAAGVELSWNRGIGAAETERRIVEHHAPYHAEIDRLIMRRVVRGIRPLLFAVHSFTPMFDGHRRNFDIGILYERHQGLAQILVRSLREAGLAVRYNQPYSGMAGMMYSVDRHGKHHQLACLEIEVNHDLVGRPGAAAALGRRVSDGIRELLARLKS